MVSEQKCVSVSGLVFELLRFVMSEQAFLLSVDCWAFAWLG